MEHFTSRNHTVPHQQGNYELQSLSLLVQVTSIRTMRPPVPTSFGWVTFLLEWTDIGDDGMCNNAGGLGLLHVVLDLDIPVYDTDIY